MAGEFSQKYCC